MTATELHWSGPSSPPDNAAELRRDAVAERRALLGLCTPGLLLVGLLLFIPIGWLFWLSFFDEHGNVTLAHYARLVEQGSYLSIFGTTFQVGFTVTVACALIGYPLAYMLARLPARWSNLLMLAVLTPFWTSLLVRTYAWLVLLQRRGVVNDLLLSLGLVDRPLALVNNFTGTVIGMTHIMIPFLVLPLYASMRTIDTTYLRAAANLGASPTRAFWTVYFPLSLPGLVAGLLLIFVLCLGFYVTPAILGGGKVIMLSMRIENSVSLYPSWGAASALGVVLLVATVGLLLLATRIADWQRRR